MQGVGPEVLGSPPGYWRPGLDAGEGSVFVVVAAADGNPELGFDGLGDVPVGAAWLKQTAEIRSPATLSSRLGLMPPWPDRVSGGGLW